MESEKHHHKKRKKELASEETAERLSIENAGPMQTIVLGVQDCPVDMVTVYNDRAEVLRRIEVNQEPGAYEIQIEGLSPSLDPDSLHVSGGEGKATIVEVSSRARHELDEDVQTAIHKKKEQIVELEDVITQLEDQREISAKRRKWLDELADEMRKTPKQQAKDFPGFLTPDYMGKMASFMEFYGQQLDDIGKRMMELNRKLKETKKRLSILKQEVSSSGSSHMKERRIVFVSLLVASSKISLQVAYIIKNAKWHAMYDCRVDSNAGKVCVTYYGEITNSTGEDWNEVNLALSTATPSVGGNPPELPTAAVKFVEDAPLPVLMAPGARSRNAMPTMMMAQRSAIVMDAEVMLEEERMLPPSPVAVMTTKASEGLSSSTFTIPRPATILSDGQGHKVTVAIVDLEPRLSYTIVPRLSLNAFLKATTTNTSEYPFLAGPVNIFMDNNFVSTSQLKEVAVNEEFAFFLGSDRAIKVEYRPAREVKDQAGWVKKTSIQTFHSVATIKNTKAKEVAIVVYDQLPRSNDERIKVTPIEPDPKKESHVTLNELTHNLEWRIPLAAGKSLELPCKFSVEWPKGMSVTYKWT